MTGLPEYINNIKKYIFVIYIHTLLRVITVINNNTVYFQDTLFKNYEIASLALRDTHINFCRTLLVKTHDFIFCNAYLFFILI